MKTAQEARAATIVQIDNIAREFVINEVSEVIEKKITQGCFSLIMPLKGEIVREDYLSGIVNVLKEKGYTAEVFDQSNDRHDDEIYINISWEE